MTINDFKNMRYRTKVQDVKNGELWDFGYISKTGRIVCYEPGAQDMQSAAAFEPESLRLPIVEKHLDK